MYTYGPLFNHYQSSEIDSQALTASKHQSLKRTLSFSYNNINHTPKISYRHGLSPLYPNLTISHHTLMTFSFSSLMLFSSANKLAGGVISTPKIQFHRGPDDGRGLAFMELKCWVTNITPITTIRQPTSVLKKRAPGCLVWTKPYTPLEVTRIRSVSPSFEKSSPIRAWVGDPGSSIVANKLPPGDINTASCSPAARITCWLSCARKERAFRVGITRQPSIIPDGEGRFDQVTPVETCHCQVASWPCKPGAYDVICKEQSSLIKLIFHQMQFKHQN